MHLQIEFLAFAKMMIFAGCPPTGVDSARSNGRCFFELDREVASAGRFLHHAVPAVPAGVESHFSGIQRSVLVSWECRRKDVAP